MLIELPLLLATAVSEAPWSAPSAVPVALLALLLAALLPGLSCPWGPGTHMEYSERLIRRRREALPRDKAQLISEERAAFTYGSLAADLITFKAYGGHYNHCHRWTIVDDMLELSSSPSEEAFAFGYLTHLAADTVAHNHYVPFHLARFARSGKGLGHLYWELTADRFVDDSRWAAIGALQGDARLDRLDDLVHRTVERTALPMRANKVLFNHVVLVGSRERWRRRMTQLQPLSRVRLEEPFLESFRLAATERAALALREGGVQRLAHIDTNGHEAQASAMEMRRQARGESPFGLRWNAPATEEARAALFLDGLAELPEEPRPPLWTPR